MQLRFLSVLSLAAALMMAATVGLAAGQGSTHGRLNEAPPWVHKVPEFVCDRVELVPGQAVAQPPPLNGRDRLAREQTPDPRGHDSICANISQFAVPLTTGFRLSSSSPE